MLNWQAITFTVVKLRQALNAFMEIVGYNSTYVLDTAMVKKFNLILLSPDTLHYIRKVKLSEFYSLL